MKHFTIEEFACKCGSACLPDNGIDETLMRVLDLARDKLNSPLHITSGYRCLNHNKNVGGATNSYHTQGKAADVYSDYVDAHELKDVLKLAMQELGVQGGLQEYVEQGFVHVDTRGCWASWC